MELNARKINVAGEPSHNALYRNLGSWKFEDVSKASGADDASLSLGVAVADVEGDAGGVGGPQAGPIPLAVAVSIVVEGVAALVDVPTIKGLKGLGVGPKRQPRVIIDDSTGK